MTRNREKKFVRRRRGVAIVEFCSGLSFFLVLVLLSVDVGLMLYGAFINDRICRDAARAAAGGKTKAEAEKLAFRVIEKTSSNVTWLDPTKLSGAIEYQDYGGTFTPSQSPYVTVTTETKVRPPAPIVFAMAGFTNSDELSFFQTYTFPIVRVK
jgi:Flp pilus assembly protein TadG